MKLSPKMGLVEWDQETDDYDYIQLVNNWNILDFHDHTPGRGTQIPRGGIAPGAIGPNELGTDVPWVPSQGPVSIRPSAGIFGRLFYASDTDVWAFDSGTAWKPFTGGGIQGVSTLTFGGGSASTTLVVNHSLGATPTLVHLTCNSTTSTDGIVCIPWLSSKSSTQINVSAQTYNNSQPTGGRTLSVAWMVR